MRSGKVPERPCGCHYWCHPFLRYVSERLGILGGLSITRWLGKQQRSRVTGRVQARVYLSQARYAGGGKEWCDTRYPWDVCQPQHLINYRWHFFFCKYLLAHCNSTFTVTPSNDARYPITIVGVTLQFVTFLYDIDMTA